MIGRLADKIVFGAALFFALQMPQLVDHYHQFLSGLYESTKWQVDGYEATAKQHEYSHLKAMIDHHLRNEVASVRTDAQQKLSTLDLYNELTNGVRIFDEGNLLDKAIYMFNPVRYEFLEKTIINFKLGIPLTINGIAFGVVFGLILNYVISLPFILWGRRKKVPNK